MTDAGVHSYRKTESGNGRIQMPPISRTKGDEENGHNRSPHRADAVAASSGLPPAAASDGGHVCAVPTDGFASASTDNRHVLGVPGDGSSPGPRYAQPRRAIRVRQPSLTGAFSQSIVSHGHVGRNVGTRLNAGFCDGRSCVALQKNVDPCPATGHRVRERP